MLKDAIKFTNIQTKENNNILFRRSTMKPIKNAERIEKLRLQVPSDELAKAVLLTTAKELGRQLLMRNIDHSQIRRKLREFKVLDEQ